MNAKRIIAAGTALVAGALGIGVGAQSETAGTESLRYQKRSTNPGTTISISRTARTQAGTATATICGQAA